MNPQWSCSLAPAELILVFALAARLLTRSWTHPATLFPLVWAIQTLMPILFAPDLQIYASGIWWIALACFVAQSGALLTAAPRRTSVCRVPAALVRAHLRSATLRPLTIIVLCALPVGMIYCYLTVAEPYRSLSNLLSLDSIAQMTAADSVLRYTQSDYRPSLPVQLLSSAIYLAPACGGIIYALRRNKRDALIAFATFTPAVCVSITQGTKASVLFSGLFSLVTYIACTEYTRRRPRAVTIVACTAVVGLLLGGLMGVTDALRAGEVPTIGSILGARSPDRTRTMVFGGMVAFSQWYDQSSSSRTEATYGAVTFAGPADLLGLRGRPAGVYTDSEYVAGESASNVYTYMRGLIHDFGFVGALLALFGVGLGSGWAYREAQAQNLAAMPIIAVFYAFWLWPFGSIFAYNSVIVALVGVTACWWLAFRSDRPRVRRAAEVSSCPT